MDDSLRHARHVNGNPDPNCEVCRVKAEQRHRRAHQDMRGVPLAGAESATVRAVGGYVQQSERFVR
jgi:hypothetical protein